jgi:anti-sigma factor RsiW
MATCRQTKLLLGPFDDGELEPHEMEDVAFHIVDCTDCKAALDSYRQIGVALRDAIVVPALDGFAQAVQMRLEGLREPLPGRIARWLKPLVERFGAAAALGATAAAAAVITAALITPYARTLANGKEKPSKVVSENLAAVTPPPAPQASASTVINDLSKVEAQRPSVALWNEPRTDTTVIWVPN